LPRVCTPLVAAVSCVCVCVPCAKCVVGSFGTEKPPHSALSTPPAETARSGGRLGSHSLQEEGVRAVTAATHGIEAAGVPARQRAPQRRCCAPSLSRTRLVEQSAGRRCQSFTVGCKRVHARRTCEQAATCPARPPPLLLRRAHFPPGTH